MKCCRFDHDGDGNCHIHSAPGVVRLISSQLVSIDASRVAWFAEYRRRNRKWGVFPGLDVDRFDLPADGGDRSQWEASTRSAAEWFDRITPAQRKRLRMRVDDELHTVRPGAGR